MDDKKWAGRQLEGPKVTDKRGAGHEPAEPAKDTQSRRTEKRPSKEAALVNDVLKFCSEHPSWPYILSKPRPARKQLAIAIAKTIVRWPIGKKVSE